MKWYAVRTRSRHEKSACSFLTNKSFETFLPLMESWSRRKDRKKKIALPLFPGYFFVYSEMSPELRTTLIQTPGVVDVLRNANGNPAPIPDDQIETVKKIVSSDTPPRNHPYLKEGDKVVVTQGQLEGAVGFFLSSDHQSGKLVVSVDMLGHSLEVDMEAFMVEKF
ncbi:MAG: transcription termination/antitermination protein NusG [Nitrospinota bacterium]